MQPLYKGEDTLVGSEKRGVSCMHSYICLHKT